jgi:hypothetical protein
MALGDSEYIHLHGEPQPTTTTLEPLANYAPSTQVEAHTSQEHPGRLVEVRFIPNFRP